MLPLHGPQHPPAQQLRKLAVRRHHLRGPHPQRHQTNHTLALPGIRCAVVWLVWRLTSRMSALCRSCRCSFTHARQAFNQRSCRQSCSNATALLPTHTRRHAHFHNRIRRGPTNSSYELMAGLEPWYEAQPIVCPITLQYLILGCGGYLSRRRSRCRRRRFHGSNPRYNRHALTESPTCTESVSDILTSRVRLASNERHCHHELDGIHERTYSGCL